MINEGQHSGVLLRDANSDDIPAILKLNEDFVLSMSPLDRPKLEKLLKVSRTIVAIKNEVRSPSHSMDKMQQVATQEKAEKEAKESGKGQVVGFVICLRENVDYASKCYQWFQNNFSDKESATGTPIVRSPAENRFMYIDRVAVDERYHHSGIGSLLYREISKIAALDGVSRLVCEILLEPKKNAKSEEFHVRLGFRHINEYEYKDENGKEKVVAMYEKVLS